MPRSVSTRNSGMPKLSKNGTAAIFALGYHTVRRWWRWLHAEHEAFSFHLRSRFAPLGHGASFTGFWLAFFQLMPSCKTMAWIDDDCVAAP